MWIPASAGMTGEVGNDGRGAGMTVICHLPMTVGFVILGLDPGIHFLWIPDQVPSDEKNQKLTTKNISNCNK
jgi:hypothetical protein